MNPAERFVYDNLCLIAVWFVVSMVLLQGGVG